MRRLFPFTGWPKGRGKCLCSRSCKAQSTEHRDNLPITSWDCGVWHCLWRSICGSSSRQHKDTSTTPLHHQFDHHHCKISLKTTTIVAKTTTAATSQYSSHLISSILSATINITRRNHELCRPQSWQTL